MHSAFNTQLYSPAATDTPQEEGFLFQTVVVFTSIDPVTAQLQHTNRHPLHSQASANDPFVQQQVRMVRMRAGDIRYAVTL